MKPIYYKTYWLFPIFAILLISCTNDSNDDIVVPPIVKDYSIYDLDGTWILKGNSSTMALVNLDFHRFDYGGKSYSASYKLIEYELTNNSYIFKGMYDGGLILDGNNIEFAKAASCKPTISPKGTHEYGDGIKRQSIFCKEFKIEELSETRLLISTDDSFYQGDRNTDYLPSFVSPTVGTQEFVDLGLSVYWAKCNIGATKAEEVGYYSGWADPTARNESLNDGDYPGNGDNPLSICGTSLDIATKKWGNKWRMPTEIEMAELAIGCISEDITYNDIQGTKFTGITGKSVFLPKAGERKGSVIEGFGIDLFYWAGERPLFENCAYGLFSGSIGGYYAHRHLGCQVRAVCTK